jgi:lysophospholipase L1-like esterase
MAISLVGVSSVLYLGDSLTAGLYSTTEATSWRKLTDTFLATQGISAGTFMGGTGGTTAGFQNILGTLTAQAADLCFIELGTNDAGQGVSAATFETNLRAIADAVYDGNNSCIFVFMTTWNAGTPGTTLDAVIREVAADYGDHVVDLAPIYQAPETYRPDNSPTWVSPYVSDGWHPNDTGHKAMANAVESLFDADLMRLNTPVGTTGIYATAADFIYVGWSCGSDFTNSGEFGVFVRTAGADPTYLGALVATNGEAAYLYWANTTYVAAPAASGYTIAIGWRATPGSGAFTSFWDFPGVTLALTSSGAISVTAPAANGAVAIGQTVTVGWDYGAAIGTGEFAIWAVDTATGTYLIGDVVAADGSRTYTHALTMASADGIEAGSTYEFVVAYRTTGGWTRFATAPGVYSVIPQSGTTTLLYGGLDLNDGTTYRLLDGFDPGEKQKSWDEVRSYTGQVAQYNVTEAALVQMTIPLLVEAASLTALHAAIDAINAKIDAGAQTLIFSDGSEPVTYSCVHSPRVAFRPDSPAVNKFWTRIDMTLYRTP